LLETNNQLPLVANEGELGNAMPNKGYAGNMVVRCRRKPINYILYTINIMEKIIVEMTKQEYKRFESYKQAEKVVHSI